MKPSRQLDSLATVHQVVTQKSTCPGFLTKTKLLIPPKAEQGIYQWKIITLKLLSPWTISVAHTVTVELFPRAINTLVFFPTAKEQMYLLTSKLIATLSFFCVHSSQKFHLQQEGKQENHDSNVQPQIFQIDEICAKSML